VPRCRAVGMSDGSTTGVWIPSDSDLLARYDARFATGDRSAHIRAAMELHLMIDEVLEQADVADQIEAGRARRAFVRQAVLDQLRREFETEG